MKRRLFSKEDDAFIKANYLEMGGKWVSLMLGWSSLAIRKRASKIGANKQIRRWTVEEDAIIKDSFGKLKLAELAQKLNRNISEVSNRCKKIGFKKWRTRSGTHSGRPVDGFCKNVPIYTHRVVASKMIGRPLKKTEIVHHVDFDKWNNDPSNLYIFKDRSSHRRSHSSFESIVPMLVRTGLVFFNQESEKYEINYDRIDLIDKLP